jgi:hypothetical protein
MLRAAHGVPCLVVCHVARDLQRGIVLLCHSPLPTELASGQSCGVAL